MSDLSPTRHDVAVLTFFIIISLLLYARSFDNGFRQDDAVYLRHAETASLLDSLRPSDDIEFYRPASLVLFRLEHLLFGRRSGAYIAFNFALHCLTAILMFLVLRRISPVPGSASAAAGLFLLGLFHYGKTVMWACCCGPIASTALSLAGIYLAVRWAECGAQDGARIGRVNRLLLAAVLMSCAILFHEGAIVTPVIAALAVPAGRRTVRLRGRGMAALLLIPIPAFLVAYGVLASIYPVYRVGAQTIGAAPAHLVRYLGFAVVPIQRTGIIDAPPVLRRLIGIAPQLQQAAGVMVLGTLGALTAAGKRGLRTLGAWAPAAILPYTLITLPGDWLELRYLYFAAIPLCGLAAAGWHRLAFSRAAALRAVAIVLIAAAVLGASTLVILLERHYASFPGV